MQACDSTHGLSFRSWWGHKGLKLDEEKTGSKEMELIDSLQAAMSMEAFVFGHKARTAMMYCNQAPILINRALPIEYGVVIYLHVQFQYVGCNQLHHHQSKLEMMDEIQCVSI